MLCKMTTKHKNIVNICDFIYKHYFLTKFYHIGLVTEYTVVFMQANFCELNMTSFMNGALNGAHIKFLVHDG